MKKIINIVLLLITIGMIILSGCRKNLSHQKEITIDSLYVDYFGDITYYIHNYQDTEECVRTVFECIGRTKHPSMNFITNKKGTHIEHNYIYTDPDRTDRFTFSKDTAITNSLNSIYIIFRKNKFTPVDLIVRYQSDTTYFVGDFEEMNFTVLKSFQHALAKEDNLSRKYHKYVLKDRRDEPKLELIHSRDGENKHRTYKIY